MNHLDQRRWSSTRVGGEHSLGIGEQDETIRVDQIGDKRSDAVVVAPANLIIGNASFSLTTGTTPSSRRQVSVWRACRY